MTDSDKIYVKKLDWNDTNDVFLSSHFQPVDYIIATGIIHTTVVHIIDKYV